jgi:hypothetical protein
MTDRRQQERNERAADLVERELHVAEVRTAVQFLVRGIERLEGSLDRLQQTVREDFASTGDLEMVKAAVTQLRIDLDRRLTDLERDQRAQHDRMTAHVEDRVKGVSTRNDRDVRIARWFIYAAIPSGVLALGTLAWEIFKAWFKTKTGGGTP